MCNAGLNYTINIVPNSGYTAGTLVGISSTGIVTDNVSIKATGAIAK